MLNEGVNDMTAAIYAINDILKEPPKDYTEKEARKVLRECGILTTKNSIRVEYKELIIDTKKK
jgi:hypothetical protein